MLVLNARVTVAPDARPGFLAAIASLATATRQEPGCLDLACWEDPWSPGAFIVLGEWCDRAALVAHERSAHVAMFKREAAPLLRSRLPSQVYEVTAVRDLGDVLGDLPSS